MIEKNLIMFIHHGIAISITEMTTPSGNIDRYVLSWDDGVANQWVESYPTLPLALARAAAIAVCAEESHRTFPHDEFEFVSVADAFLYGVAR
jgi:hypothetical protein